MLLLFRAATGTAGSAGISFGVSGSVTATALAAITFGVPAPLSAELNVYAVSAITLGASGNNIPITPAAGTTGIALNVVGRPAFAVTGTTSTILNVAGTVGSFFDGQGTATLTFSGIGAGRVQTTAPAAIVLDVSGLPNITGGTITSAATSGITLNLLANAGFIDFTNVTLHLDATATGVSTSGVNPEAVILDKRPRTTLRSFLIGS